MLTRRRADLLGGGILLLLIGALAALFFDRNLDRSYITYRYADNLASGNGLFYNPGGLPFLSYAVSPLYAALLASAHALIPDYPLLSNMAGIVCIAAGGWMLALLLRAEGEISSLAAAGFYSVFPLLWGALGLETPLWMALLLAGLWLHLRGWSEGAAILLGIAALIRPEGLAMAAVVIADGLAAQRMWRPLSFGLLGGIIGVGGLVILSTYPGGGWLPGFPPGSVAALLPDTAGSNVLAGLVAVTVGLVALSWLWIPACATCLIGASRLRSNRPAILLTGWALLHLIVLLVLQVGVYGWSFAPLAAALAALFGLGISLCITRIPSTNMRWAAAGAAGLVALAAGAHSAYRMISALPEESLQWAKLSAPLADPLYEQAAGWLRQKALPDAVVAAVRPGLLGYQTKTQILNYYGLFQPEVADALARGDGQWWLANYRPDYVVLTDDERTALAGFDPANDEWFAAAYTEVARFQPADPTVAFETIAIWQRVAPARPMTKALINLVDYPGGLTLNGIASDFPLTALDTGGAGLIRLEWLLDSAIETPQVVTIRMQGQGEGAVAGLGTRTIDFSRWPRRRLITTFHFVQIANGLPPGIYEISIGIGSTPANQTWQLVGRAKVALVGSGDLGGISGSRTDFGAVALIGYRLGHKPEGLEILLLWEAVRPAPVDYRVAIQLRDDNGTVVFSTERDPLDGNYPTSFWSSGEQVTDTHLLDIAAIPPGDFGVYIGLVNPDGSRILTLDGKDSVFIGRVNNEP